MPEMTVATTLRRFSPEVSWAIPRTQAEGRSRALPLLRHLPASATRLRPCLRINAIDHVMVEEMRDTSRWGAVGCDGTGLPEPMRAASPEEYGYGRYPTVVHLAGFRAAVSRLRPPTPAMCARPSDARQPKAHRLPAMRRLPARSDARLLLGGVLMSAAKEAVQAVEHEPGHQGSVFS